MEAGSILKPNLVESIESGCKLAQKYFAQTFNDNSSVLFNAAPMGVYKCTTTANPQNEFYFKVNG